MIATCGYKERQKQRSYKKYMIFRRKIKIYVRGTGTTRTPSRRGYFDFMIMFWNNVLYDVRFMKMFFFKLP